LNRRSLVLILVGLALLMIATTIKSGWLYLVASVLFSLLLLGLVSGRLAVRSIDITRSSQREAFEGELFRVVLKVRNRGRMARYFLMVRDSGFDHDAKTGALARFRRQRADYRESLEAGTAPGGAARRADGGAGANGRGALSRSVAFRHLGRGVELEAEYEILAARRGVFEYADLSVSSGGTFGSTEVSRRIRVRSPLTVFPRIYPLSSFPFEPRSAAAPEEAFEWSRKGIGQDYFGVREYVRGDSLRHIHWRSSARQGLLIVKEYQQEFRPSTGLVVLLAEPAFGDVGTNSMEDGLRCAASILNYHQAMGIRPRLVLAGEATLEVLEEADLYQGLAALAGYRPVPASHALFTADGHAEALASAASELAPGSTLTVVTNAQVGSVAVMLESAAPSDLSVVVVIDDSYGGDWDVGVELLEVARLETPASREANLFVMTRGQEIGSCLSEPLRAIA
jgi:uncharacterized protein (DUF58 family)